MVAQGSQIVLNLPPQNRGMIWYDVIEPILKNRSLIDLKSVANWSRYFTTYW